MASERIAGGQFEQERVREALRSLPVPVAPPSLRTRLRVAASRELLRKRTRATWRGWLRVWLDDVRLWTENLMRPFAIPTAGGFVSSLLLFRMIAPTLYVPSVPVNNDIPLGLYTRASMKTIAPISIQSDELVEVLITVDDQGRMVDYTVANWPPSKKNPAFHRNLENSLLLARFTPATNFGRPMSGTVRLFLRSSYIDVKG